MSIKKKIKKIYTEQPGENIFKKDAPYEKFLFIKLGMIFSMPLLRLILKTKLRFHPSILSALGLSSNVLGGISFAYNQLIIGAVLFYLGLVFDLVDGPYARLTDQYSSEIKRFDSICDRIAKASCFLGLWYSQYFLKDIWYLGFLWIMIYYLLEVYATKFLSDRFVNTRNVTFTVWEVSFLIFIVGPLLNQVYYVLPISVFLLGMLYIFKSYKKYLQKESAKSG
jgi:phosphatidylglycerophosphate synthase